MKNDFLVAITQLCNERNLSKEVVLGAIEQALVSAYRRNFGGGQNISAQIDPTTGKVRIFAAKTIVDEARDRRMEIALTEAKSYDPMAQVGEVIKIETTPQDFGRIAAQTAKQVVLQRIREAERDTLFSQFSDREGEIVLGTIHNMDSQNITVNLGKIEAILPRSEQIPNERYRHNQKIRAYIAEVNKTSRGPQVVLSRTHRNMLRRLFELEVPEIFNGQVEIKAIAREPGSRSKIAVAALQDGVDPVGACVGQRGIRIQAIVNELSGEKIDVVEWSTDTAKFIANSLSPAKVLLVRLAEDENGDKVANVTVDEKMLSLAIGKEGQNARLAAKLTGWRIDIKSDQQLAEEAKLKAEAEAERLAAMVPEEVPVEPAEELPAAIQVEQLEGTAVEATIVEPAVEPKPSETETVEPVVAQESVQAPTAQAPAEAVSVAEGEAQPTEVPVEGEQTFEQAWEEFEAEEGEDLTPEEMLKRKADRRKRQTLVFDEKLGKVIAKRKRKGGRARDWTETLDEE
ncbi:MAG: transcription termination/antitermination protein NusA [Chloroflexi bacterium]|nr:transcription termination/antitermination protein NusA [Chloroflexota bacterium]